MSPVPPAEASDVAARGETKARLFVAVWPPPDVVDLIAETVARLRTPTASGQGASGPAGSGGIRWTRPEQWHVTLVFLGARRLDAAIEAFRSVRLPPGPVTATLGPATGRFGSRILHVPVAGLDEVAAAVRRVLPGDDERPFHGHLTLARADSHRRRGRHADERGADRRVDLSSVVGIPLSASFPVNEVTLVASELGRGPARYEVVERLTL